MKIFKWFYPGMNIKRWLFLLSTGVLLVGMGVSGFLGIFAFTEFVREILLERVSAFGRMLSNRIAQAILILLGIVCISLGIQHLIKSILALVVPRREKELVDIAYQERQLRRGPKIVVVGGGTGLSTLLRGIKEYTSNIGAIVTVADTGGSSGRLRQDFGILPPGDIRNCLVALADSEPLLQKLFQYRFGSQSALGGHSFGNLFITALSEVTKDFGQAIKESSKVLAIRGQVIPVTLENVNLEARLVDGIVIVGQDQIAHSPKPIEEVYLKPKDSRPTPEALEAISSADAILVGPGSLYTSIIPNLLVEGIVDQITKSKAMKVYICNVMTQPGETDNYSASDHIVAIIKHIGRNLFDYVLVNTEVPIPALTHRYAKEDAFPVKVDEDRINQLGLKVIKEELLGKKDYLRHDPGKIALAIMKLAGAQRSR
jgi:uncharacterized cofD-like protein